MNTQERPPFSTLLLCARLAAGLSQERLAERAGLSARTLSDLERGVAAHPRLETVRLLAAALALPDAERTALLASARPDAAPLLRPAVTPPQRPGATAPLPAPLAPLIGRDRELALLAAALDGAGTDTTDAAPAAPLLLLAGEPGLGKTRLLQAAAQQATAQGWTVLIGGCQRHGGQEPYAPLLDALTQHLQALSPEQQRAVLAGCAWLVRLLPELTRVLEPLPPGVVTPAQERRLLFAAVARLLANVAGPAGTVLLLDDLQWAGPDALHLLAALLRGRPTAPLRVVGAYRDTEVRPDDPLGHLRADLAQVGLVRHHALQPLAPAAAAELLADLLGAPAAGAEAALAAQVLERAGGTPFYLVSYAQALRDGGGGEAVPWDVAEGVRQRLALLPEAARHLLGVAAIVGRHMPWPLLAAVTGLPEDTVLDGLEAADRARLLREDEDDAYAFTHDVIREVVETDLGAARRAVLHRRIAEALEGDHGPASAETLAYHFVGGGASEKALVYLERAGDEAWARCAYGAAERHYREVVTRLEALGRAPDAARAREKLGEVLYRVGHYEAALRALAPAAETFRAAGDLESLGRVTVWMGRTHSLRGTPQEGIALITALLERLNGESASPPSKAALFEALGFLLFTAGQYDASLPASEKAAALARASGDDRTRVLAEWNRVNLLQLLGRLEEALRVGQEVFPLVERVGDLDCLVRAHIDLAYIPALRGALALSRATIARGLALAERMGDPSYIALTLALQGWFAALSGEWRDAHTALERGVSLSRHNEPSWYTPYPLILRARVALIEGACEEAATQIQQALAVVERSGDLQARRWAYGVAAEVDILEGRPEAASARLIPLLDRPGLEECDVTLLLPVLAWAYLEHGALEEAAQTLEQALVRARREEMRLVLVDALRVQALLALRQERWDEATGSLEEGLALARAMPYPYAEARLLHLDGLRHSQHGEPTAARRRLEAALALFQRVGAPAEAARVQAALDALSPLSQKQERRIPQVTDAQWARIAALLPSRPRGRGRPRADDRRIAEAILYVQQTGCAWSELPAELGDKATAHRRWQEWQTAGLWERIAALARPPQRDAGGG